MKNLGKEIAIQKIIKMPVDRVAKLLIFMAGMEAEQIIYQKNEIQRQIPPSGR